MSFSWKSSGKCRILYWNFIYLPYSFDNTVNKPKSSMKLWTTGIKEYSSELMDRSSLTYSVWVRLKDTVKWSERFLVWQFRAKSACTICTRACSTRTFNGAITLSPRGADISGCLYSLSNFLVGTLKFLPILKYELPKFHRVKQNVRESGITRFLPMINLNLRTWHSCSGSGKKYKKDLRILW